MLSLICTDCENENIIIVIQIMSEQQQVREAKEAGIYLIALGIAQAVLMWAVWKELNLMALIVTGFCVSYLLYRAINLDAFRLVYFVLTKYFRYKKIHQYFSHCQNHQHDGRSIWATDSESPQRFFEKIVIREPAAKGNRKLFFYNKRSQQERNQSPTVSRNFQRELKSQQYLRARDVYKKTIEDLKSKGLEQKWFEEFCGLVKNNYRQKVKQLLKMSEENIKTITSILEENFEVKIVKNFKEIPEKLEPVHIDEAIARIAVIHRTNCLPWAVRMKKQEDTTQLFKHLVQLVEVRSQIDSILCNQFQILQQEREKLIVKIRRQLEEKKGGRQLLQVLLEIYNANITLEEYKIVWQTANKAKGGLFVVESTVGGYLHGDLKVIREGREIFYRARPGEDNVWSLLSLAAQLLRFKL